MARSVKTVLTGGIAALLAVAIIVTLVTGRFFHWLWVGLAIVVLLSLAR